MRPVFDTVASKQALAHTAKMQSASRRVAVRIQVVQLREGKDTASAAAIHRSCDCSFRLVAVVY